MSNQIETVANQAVFQLQLKTRDAVRFIQRNADVDESTAKQAVKTVTTFHKQPKTDPWRYVTV